MIFFLKSVRGSNTSSAASNKWVIEVSSTPNAPATITYHMASCCSKFDVWTCVFRDFWNVTIQQRNKWNISRAIIIKMRRKKALIVHVQSPSINRHIYMCVLFAVGVCVCVSCFEHTLNNLKFIHKTSWWSLAWLTIIMHARVCAATVGNICISFCFLFVFVVVAFVRCRRTVPYASID